MVLPHYFPELSLPYSVIFGKVPDIRHLHNTLYAFRGRGISIVPLHTPYPLVWCRRYLLSGLFHRRRYCLTCRTLPMEEAISAFDMPFALNRSIFALCTLRYSEVWEFASFISVSQSPSLRVMFPYFLFLPINTSS